MSRLQSSWNGATLTERLKHLRTRVSWSGRFAGTRVGSDDPLAAWTRACAPGDLQAFLRRLAWDDIDPAVARAALEPDAPEGFPSAFWVGRLSDVTAEASACAEFLGSDEWNDEVARLGSTLPFVDVWLPLIRRARQRLLATVPTCGVVLSRESVAALERHLLAGLSRLGELAVLEDFRAAPAIPGPGPSSRYVAYVRTLLQSDYDTLFLAYPVLARQVVLLVDQWVEEIAELVARLELDHSPIAAAFGIEAGRVRRVTPGLSDRHDGGRHVMFVEFDSGLQLAYKPRDVRLERAYNEWLQWLSDCGLPAAPRVLRVLDRGAYGWIEWVEQGRAWSAAQARDYFRSAGALVCLAYVLGATDLHSENVVASLDGPVLVDTEMLMQPSTKVGPSTDIGADEWTPGPTVDSCLASGLVSAVVIDRTGVGFDVGGLRPAVPRELAVPMRRWINLRTDAIAFEPETRVHPALRNDVCVHGTVQRPEDFVDDVCGGFEDAYRFLQTIRVALMATGGPLDSFADCPVRVLFRPSDQYAAAQYLLASPRYQRRGIERSLGLETLNRVFITDTTRPPVWPLVHDEREALEALDIPRVTLPACAVDVVSTTGAVVQGYYRRSGMEATRSRVASLSSEDLARQLDQLRAALSDRSMAAPFAADAGEARGTRCAAAERIGATLLARARETADGSLAWPSSVGRSDLYGGASGLGLFFAALAAVTHRQMWRDAAERTLRPLASHLTDGQDGPLRIGACTGRPSVAYAVALSGHLLEDEGLLDRARWLACAIPPEAIDTDVVLDIEGGSAGALMALLAVHDLCPDDRLLALAGRCVARLLVTQVPAGPNRGAWLAGDDPVARPGFAHGAAGVAAALSRWASRTGDTGAFDAIRSAWGFERRIFADNAGAYPTVRSDGGQVVMAAWCHGAPGVALGRALAPAPLIDPPTTRELEVAMQLTLKAPAAQLDHLCCGNLGRADIALTVGLRTRVQPWVDSGVALSRTVASRVLSQGQPGMRGRGFQRGAATPELFQGLAGIGYQLLRSRSPRMLPSLLAFDSPASHDAGPHSKDDQ